MPTQLDSSILLTPEKILLYGGPGTGKTRLAATAPDPIYFLVIGPRNELKTLASPSFKKAYGEKDIRYDFIQEDFGERGNFSEATAYDKASDVLDEALELRAKGDFPFQTLVIENATTFMNVQMNKAILLGSLGSTVNKAMQRLREDNILQPADNDWGGAQSLMRKYINWVYNLDVHTILIAHEKIQKTVDRKTRLETIHKIEPSFVGQQREEIPGLFDNVWRCTVDGSGRSAVYKVNTVGSDVQTGKTRVGGVLRENEVNLDITNVIERFHAAGGE